MDNKILTWVFIIHTLTAEVFIIANAMNNFGWINLG